MAAQLNIKDPIFIERARELARRRGQPVTATLRKLLDREWEEDERYRREKLARLDTIIEEVRRSMPAELANMSAEDIANSIYDDDEPDGFAR